MVKLDELTSVNVINSIYKMLENTFQDNLIKKFEEEICLTPLSEYGKSKQEFFCRGFIFQTMSKSTEIISTAKRVIKDDFGIKYGLRWCSANPKDGIASLKLKDCVCFKNERRWILAKPYNENLLALGRDIPKEYKFKINNGRTTYSPKILQYLIVNILTDKILRC